MRTLPLLLALAACFPAQAATWRPLTTLSAPVVLLSDLFDDAGPHAAQPLGPAPRPGERIVVEAGQLAAIARQFGVAWRPVSGAERTVLEQPGRPLPQDMVTAALRSALAAAGAPREFDIALPGFEPPLIPMLAQPQAAAEHLDYDAPSGRFTATLRIDGAAMPSIRLAVSGRIEELAGVPVPVHALPAGSPVRAADLRIARMALSSLRAGVLRDAAQAQGLALRRPAAAGQPLLLADLVHPAAVAKGARVTLELHAPGLTVIAQGVALEAGAAGERITVLNPASHMIVDGDVTGPGRVTVAPGSVPVPADAQVAAR